MKRIISMLLAVLLIAAALPTSLFAAAEGGEGMTFILPSSLTTVEAQAFAGNAMVSQLVVPNTVTSIGSQAFEGCTGLTEVVIASRDVSIADDAFDGCSSDMVFYAYSGSDAMVWAMGHGYVCEALDDGSDYLARFEAMVSHSGFDSSILQSGNRFASCCLIVRTAAGANRLPDISDYHPTDIFRSDSNLYYVQFANKDDTEACFEMLYGAGLLVEPDMLGANDDVFAQSVTIAEFWGTNDTMGFDDYAPFVAERTSGSVTIAIVDSGVSQSVWNGKFSSHAASFVGGSVYSDTVRHGSKVASIMNDCLGDAVGRVTLLPIKVVNSSSMYRTSVIIEGIKHAVKRGADIINLSFGWDVSEGTSPEIARQISNANAQGIHVVAAAGNGSGRVMFPANCSGVLAVSALTYSTESGYSVRSRTGSEVDYTAPGLHLSTSSYPNIDLAGDVLGSASTSYAAPQIAAALALIKLDPTRKDSNAVSVLNSTCLDLGAEGLSSSAYGRGLPQLDRLAIIPTKDITLTNANGGDIPSHLWLGEKDSSFQLAWQVVPANATKQAVTVTSSDDAVVSVQQDSKQALISAVGAGTATITVDNGEVAKQIDLVVEQPVTEILITGTDGKLIIGKEVQLAVAVLPEDAASKAVAWKSSDETVATVTQEGLVTGVKVGQTTITCEAQDGYGTSASVNLTVVNVPNATSVEVTAAEKEIVNNAVTLEVGESLTLETAVLPADAEQKVYYSLFPQGIVTISENGVVQAVAPGTATLMITASSGQNVYTGLSVTVVISPESISVSADKTTLDIGGNAVMSATVLPGNATDKTVVWESRNTAVATVNSSTGVVTAVAPGTAEITGRTVNGKQASVSITVRQPITITFNPNDGLCGEPTRVAYSGYELGTLPEAMRTYWLFNGWYTAKSGGVKVTAESVFTEDTILYAQWTGQPYTVSFNANGGTCAMAEMSARVGTKLGSLPAATKDEYAFKGWYTAAEGGREVTADYLQSTTEPLTLYAQWTAKPYTMTFNANGGTCETATKVGTVDSPIGVLPVPERANYIFNGWFNGLLQASEQITEDYVQSTTAPITVYASWSPMPYTMIFDAKGGECEQAELACLVDTVIGELPVPTRAYYTFSGWYIEGDTPIYVTAAYQQAEAQDVTVTARWTANPYTVTLDANGGTCETKSLTGYTDAALGALPVPERAYYTFDGWFKADGTKVEATYVQATDASFALTAQWTPMTYTVTFDANGGECTTASMTGTVDAAIGELPVPTRQYYTFNGWFTAATGGTQITSAYVQSSDESITVYAQWTNGTYTITYDPNGGVCDTLSREYKVDMSVGTWPRPTREYYTFKGWYLEPECLTQLERVYKHPNLDPFTVYAKWAPMGYTMQFDANGGSLPEGAASLVDYLVDTPVGALVEPTREYYTFDGWYTAAEGGTKITASYAHPTTETITVYAHWQPYSYTMYFNANGGSCGTNSRTCYVDTAIGTLPTPTRAYHVFNGWFTAASGGTQVTAAYLQTAPTSTTIYAQWTPNEYTYTMVYKSSNGTSLGSTSMRFAIGTTMTVIPPDFAGYTTPATQNVTWDTDVKTVTFTYAPIQPAFYSTGSQKWCSSPTMHYSAKVEYQNRTANSVQIRVVWTTTMSKGGWSVYSQKFHGTCSGVSIPKTTVVAFNAWKTASSSAKSKTGTSAWITVPLTTTGATTLKLDMSYYQYNSNELNMYNYNGTTRVVTSWTVNIPAY